MSSHLLLPKLNMCLNFSSYQKVSLKVISFWIHFVSILALPRKQPLVLLIIILFMIVIKRVGSIILHAILMSVSFVESQICSIKNKILINIIQSSKKRLSIIVSWHCPWYDPIIPGSYQRQGSGFLLSRVCYA